MLTAKPDFLTIAEVNPPTLPDPTHRRLEGSWSHVLITDNVFGKIRVSPYAFGARITHDVPAVHPSVVVSTRDRNVLAIESEVRGALGNGVDSFLVVSGDTFAAVDHLAVHYEVVEHLRTLQAATPAFEVGMPTRFDRKTLQRRIDSGAQFIVTAPVVDAASVEDALAALDPGVDDPPVYLAVIPPFSRPWVERASRWGAVSRPDLVSRIETVAEGERRRWAWQQVSEMRERAMAAGASGVVLMGLKFETTVGEAADELLASTTELSAAHHADGAPHRHEHPHGE